MRHMWRASDCVGWLIDHTGVQRFSVCSSVSTTKNHHHDNVFRINSGFVPFDRNHIDTRMARTGVGKRGQPVAFAEGIHVM
ncbi:Uncharacterised protein [Mycobacteroides abscessus subsp. abscessus]|nr:Uncharacterised protein [Mycobacteroides abscessus subsp. abscessus]SKO69172.1 Uncharacterised protein [Mycobacteroides abscessus subsp. bolletii]